MGTSLYSAKCGLKHKATPLILSDAIYPRVEQRGLYELLARYKMRNATYPLHMLARPAMIGLLETKFGSDIVGEALDWDSEFIDSYEPFKLPRSVPKFEVKGSDLIHDKCMEILRVNHHEKEYFKRAAYELGVIDRKGLMWYFALVADVIEHVRSKGELIGPGRGSSCGSLVCKLLGITSVDPLEHGLLFERFIDTSRDDLPDIDIDFTPRGRQLAYDFVLQNYGGEDHIAQIITVSRYQHKSIENDIHRDYGYDTPIPLGMYSIIDSPRHFGRHPAAIAISSRPLREIAPRNKDGDIMLESGLYRQTAELDAGVLKIDALGLTQIRIFQDFCAATGRNLAEFYRLKPQIIERFNERKYSGVFQFGVAVRSIANEVHFETFDEIADVIALARPGPRDAGYSDRWVESKLAKTPTKTGVEEIDNILKPTQGVFIYQEQVMRICREIAGFAWPEVNEVRRGIGKKKTEIIEKYRGVFVEKCKQRHGMTETYWHNLWTAIEGCGNYAFNKSHAVAYAYIAYACMAMKEYDAGEYYAAYLTHESDNKLRLEALKEWGGEFCKFDSGKSLSTAWNFEDNVMYAPLTNVIGVGDVGAVQAAAERETKGRLPAKFRKEDMRFRIETVAPIHAEFMRKHGSYQAVGISTTPVSVREFCKLDTSKNAVVLGVVDMKNVKDYKHYPRGRTSQYLSFRLTDDTGSIFARYHPYFAAKLVRAQGEIKVGKLIALKGNLYKREGFRMMFVDRYIPL